MQCQMQMLCCSDQNRNTESTDVIVDHMTYGEPNAPERRCGGNICVITKLGGEERSPDRVSVTHGNFDALSSECVFPLPIQFSRQIREPHFCY